MPYTVTSTVLVWLTAAALLGATALGGFSGRSIVAVALLALIGPVLLLRGPVSPRST